MALMPTPPLIYLNQKGIRNECGILEVCTDHDRLSRNQEALMPVDRQQIKSLELETRMLIGSWILMRKCLVAFK